ncbi:MAG TPA: hypothetical protein VGB52_06725 [Actinomycetota bacterium]
MKRTLLSLSLAIALVAMAPAAADPEDVVRGRIDGPALTPTVPRTLYLASPRTNGITGWVASLPIAEESRTYEVHPLGEVPSGLDIDVWFYRDLQGEAGTGDPCARDAAPVVGGGETGTVCPGATYAVIVLFSGADVPFELTLS